MDDSRFPFACKPLIATASKVNGQQNRVISLQPLSAVDPEAIEALLDQIFGAGRHGRAAYAVREGTTAVPDLSFIARDEGILVGSLQSWPVRLSLPEDKQKSLIMVGPVAVHPDWQNQGIGNHMTRVVTQRLDLVGLTAMMIGDPAYYEQCGFRAGPAVGWTLPDPVAPERILLRAARNRDWPTNGILEPELLRSGQRLPS